MIKTAWQLKDRIRNLAKNKSAYAQVLMKNYMMERFFILKGGMLVAAMIGLESRATMDIDGTIKGAMMIKKYRPASGTLFSDLVLQYANSAK